MTHEEIIQNNITEKYLMQQLTEEEETGFEEHMLYCSECRMELQKFEKFIAGIEDYKYQDAFIENSQQNVKKPKMHKSGVVVFRIKNILRIAAGIIILFGLSGLIYIVFLKPSNDLIISGENKIVEKSEKTENNIDGELADEIEKEKTHLEELDEDLLAEYFQPDTFYENMVKTRYRGGNFKILEPKDSINISPGQKLKFIWETDNAEELELIIINNKGIVIKAFKGKSPIELIKNSRGLFYWKLDSEEETVAAGKIYVK